MGVSGLSQWLSRTFPDCFRNYHVSSSSSSSSSSASSSPFSSRRKERVIRYDPLPMQHVALDLMSMLHNLLARSASTHPMFFFREVFEQVDAVLEAFPPEVSLVLALDGPAPAAKWVKQKRRRVKTSNKEASTKAAIDKLELTPGTTFMEEVKDALCHYACSRLLSSPSSPSRIYVSGATVPGEGELKLVQLLLYEEKRAREKQRRKKIKKKKKKRQKRNEKEGNGLAAAEKAKEETSERASLIVGDDSDLLLLAICGMVSGGRATSVFAPCKGYDQLFSVARLFGYFRETFPQNGNEEEEASCYEGFIRRTAVDFVLLVVFMGNDYIPKFQGVEWGDLWWSYVQLKQNNEKIKQQFLVDVDQHNELTLNLPLLYHILISTKRLCQFLNCHTKLFHAKETPKAKEKEKEAEVDDPSPNLQEEQEEEDDGNLFVRHWDVPAYLQALLWNIHMYLFANCGNYDFHYSFPHSPPADQLILWIQRHYRHLSYPSPSTAPSSPSSSAPSLALETTPTLTSPISVRSANVKSEPLLPHLFCLAVMPSWAKDFVVAPLRHLVMDIDTNNNNRNTNVEKENNEAEEEEEEEEEARPTRTVPTALNSMQLHMQTRRFSQLIQREAQRVELGKYSPQERRTIDFALNLLFKKKKQKEQKHSIPIEHEQKTKRKKMEDEEKEEEEDAEDVLAFEVPEGIVADDKRVLRSLLQGRRVRLLLDGERDGLVLPLWKNMNENEGREDVMKLVPVDAYRHQWDPHFRPVEESGASASSTKENEVKQKKNRSKYRNLVHL
ncbi:5'-3' exoribonuclease 2 [Balamuthia mandrillaris]